jgi:hypothetical protein
MSGYPQQQYPVSQTWPPVKPSGNPFADQVNPYAAPQVGGYQPHMPGVGAHPFAGLWRQGNLLVMHKMAPLPDICLKSNQPAQRRLKRSMHWHHPAIYIAVLISPLIYIILALCLQKTATIHIGLSDEWYVRRQMRMLIAWGTVLIGAILFGLAMLIGDQAEGVAVALGMSAFLLPLGGLIYGLIACRLVTPQRITDQYVFIKGVHPDFLNRLEPWMWNV